MSQATEILVCCGTGCIANGALQVADALEAAIEGRGIDASIVRRVCRTGCSGLCEAGPIVRFMPEDRMYYRVKPKDADAIVDSLGGEPVKRLLHREGKEFFEHMSDNPFYAKQHKIVLRDVGIIDPLSIEDYIARGGYEGLKKALEMTQIGRAHV